MLRRLASVASPNPNIVRFYDYGPSVASIAAAARSSCPSSRSSTSTGRRSPTSSAPTAASASPSPACAADAPGGPRPPRRPRAAHRPPRPEAVEHPARAGGRAGGGQGHRLRPGEAARTSAGQPTISIAGASLGYAPPEQYEAGNRRVGAQTDVFSFASVLYEVLCGTEAFPLRKGDTVIRVVARMITGERPSLARVHATVPRELRDRADLTAAIDREIARALSADPASATGRSASSGSASSRCSTRRPTAPPGAGPDESGAFPIPPDRAAHRGRRAHARVAHRGPRAHGRAAARGGDRRRRPLHHGRGRARALPLRPRGVVRDAAPPRRRRAPSCAAPRAPRAAISSSTARAASP